MPATRRNWRRWVGAAAAARLSGGGAPGGANARWSLLRGREGATTERRWTGIEPARRGSPVSAALKAVGPTRRPDTSAPTLGRPEGAPMNPFLARHQQAAVGSSAMKKLVLLAILVALGVVAAKKVRASN